MGALWRKIGRDPSGRVAIPVRYEPPEDMTPAEMETVLDESVDMSDITATLLDLAVRGYLQIEEQESKKFIFLSETDYVLHRSAKSDEGLKLHERRILLGIFGGRSSVELSSLKDEFYSRLPGIRVDLYQEVSRDGRWFPARPDQVRTRYMALALVMTFAFAIPAFVLGSAPLAISVVASGVIAALWSRHMPRKTRRGRRAHQHILGFKEFVERVEGDRLERLGLRDISSFEKLLPYAFVLGVADAWAEAFADLYTEPPQWYASHHDGPFRPRHFVSRVGRTLDTAGSVMRSTPNRGSGSSGFSSGGGFGGGGGGSW
jgi:uncharacterized membrane protein